MSELKALPERLRLPVYLYYIEGMPAEQAAKVLRISVQAFRKRLQRGRDRLRDRMESEINETDVHGNKKTAHT